MKKLIIFLVLLSIYACRSGEQLTQDRITTIDQIVLGKDKADIQRQVDSLNIPYGEFFSRWYLENYEDISNPLLKVKSYYTLQFNRKPHSSPAVNECIGLIDFVSLSGTENIIDIRVMLCNTQTPTSFQQNLKPYLSGYLSVNQNIHTNIINEITNKYILKYGQPTYIDSTATDIYVVEKGSYTCYASIRNDNRIGLAYWWRTKYMTIKLFTGLPSSNCTYNTKRQAYNYIFYKNESIPMEDGDIPCLQFPYIEYELTNTAIKEMKLRNYNI